MELKSLSDGAVIRLPDDLLWVDECSGQVISDTSVGCLAADLSS